MMMRAAMARSQRMLFLKSYGLRLTAEECEGHMDELFEAIKVAIEDAHKKLTNK